MSNIEILRDEVGYEYDSSLEFDMPLDHYAEIVSAETE